MKILIPILLVIVAIIACGCTTNAPEAQEITPAAVTTAPVTPDISGTWTGTTAGHTKTDGFREHNLPSFTITEQKGQAFTGMKEYLLPDGTMHVENFSGVISTGGKISMVDHESGIISGEMTGSDQMELMSLEDGDNAKVFITTLTRQKNES